MPKKFLTVILFCSVVICFYAIQKIKIYAPSTPSSIPIIIAAKNLNEVEITVFSNHSQANALFLKGDIEILSTGLSLGINFFNNKAPVKIINSYVAGLTYMVSYEKKTASFKDIKGKEIYIPFQGAPIEEITNYFIIKEGLKLEDFKYVYAQFPSSIELLKKGKAEFVPLPEPYVSMIDKDDKITVNFSYKDLWEKFTGKKNGYPQVGTFVKAGWLNKNREFVKKLNNEIDKAIALIKSNPDKIIEEIKPYFDVNADILKKSLKRTDFYLLTSNDLKKEITDYYKIIGKPLDENYKEFFYIY